MSDIRTKIIQVEVYEWDCPRCGKVVEGRVKPDDLICGKCTDDLWEDLCTDFEMHFDNKWCKLLSGAQFVSVLAAEGYHDLLSHWDLDYALRQADIDRIMFNKDGKRYVIHSDAVIYIEPLS